MLKVYHFFACPYSRILRICLHEKNQPFELIHEHFWEHREEYLKINPAGSTPTLIFNDKVIIRGIYATIEFLEEVDTGLKLLLGDIAQRAHTRYVFHWFTEKFFFEITRHILNEKIIRIIVNNGSPNSNSIRAAKKNLQYHLNYMTFLLSNNTYLCGEQMTIADCAAAAQLSVLDLVNDVPWDQSQKVKSWYALMKSRPSMNIILQDTMQGIVPPLHYKDPDF